MRPKVVLPLIALSVCAFGYRLALPALDLSTPQATAQSFVQALSRRDAKVMAQCVEDGNPREETVALILRSNEAPDEFKITNLVTEIEGDTAKVAVEFAMELKMRGGQPASTVSMVDILKLRKRGEEWRIVAEGNEADLENALGAGMHFLRLCASLVGPNDVMANALTNARRAAQTSTCLSNAKQIGLALMMYSQDYDEKFPRKKAPYKELIFPYIKNEEVFRCAQDAEGPISYRFNPRLEGVHSMKVKFPAQTVMLYEGKGEKPEFRHEGRAAIVFTDGHAKMMTEAEMKSVYWYADGATPAKPAPKPAKPKKRAR